MCRRPGVAKIYYAGNDEHGDLKQGADLKWFWPSGISREAVPSTAPPGVLNEFREAEICISVEAWRAAAALLRSTLEKALLANAYDERDLYKKIEAAGSDGVITSARRQRAQDLVRTLGNDVLHEEWRVVTRGEVEDAHRYVARILEDLYDDRASVEKILTAKGRKFAAAAP